MISALSEIRRRRKIAGITQTQLAKLSGVSQSLIAKLESGKIDPSFSKTKAIIDVLDGLERQEEGKAGDIMNRQLHLVFPHENLSKVVSLMRDLNISQLPVIKGGLIVGSVTEKSILESLSSGEKITLESLVEEVMEQPFPQLDQETPIPAVSELLKYNQAVLLTKKGKLTGIVTKSDLLKIIH
jgi:predicted transcriptional regulator